MVPVAHKYPASAGWRCAGVAIRPSGTAHNTTGDYRVHLAALPNAGMVQSISGHEHSRAAQRITPATGMSES